MIITLKGNLRETAESYGKWFVNNDNPSLALIDSSIIFVESNDFCIIIQDTLEKSTTSTALVYRNIS